MFVCVSFVCIFDLLLFIALVVKVTVHCLNSIQTLSSILGWWHVLQNGSTPFFFNLWNKDSNKIIFSVQKQKVSAASLFIIIIFCNKLNHVTYSRLIFISTFLMTSCIYILYNLATAHLREVMKDSSAVQNQSVWS